MPLFFLHVCDGSGFAEDSDGHELPDLAAARKAAVEGLRDILAGDLRNGHLNTACFIEIENENGQLVDTVTFAESVRLSERFQIDKRDSGHRPFDGNNGGKPPD